MLGYFSGDLLDRIRKSSILVVWTAILFLVCCIIIEGSLTWDETLPLVGFYTTTIITVFASLYHHFLKLQYEISKWRYIRGGVFDFVCLLLMGCYISQPEIMALFGVIREFAVVIRIFLGTDMGRKTVQTFLQNPAKLVVSSFAFQITLGTIMLMFPRATTDLKGASFIDALFTSTSASCVTGLTVLNTGTGGNPELQSFSFFGQLVILGLIQVGGLNIMTLSTSAVLLLGGKLSFSGRVLMANFLDEDGVTSATFMIRQIVITTFLFESLGALILSLRFLDTFLYNYEQAIYYGIFHAISAFCNAGFSLFGDNLIGFSDDFIVVLTISLLIILGGLGFMVIATLISRETWSYGIKNMFHKMSIHSRIVLVMTGFLIVGGAIGLFILDFDGAQKDMSFMERVFSSFFQSVSARTAGFNTVDIGKTARGAVFLYIILMFIGASPGGTGGGIKTTTFLILLLFIKATLLGRMDVEVYGRTIPRRIVFKSVSITVLSACLCVISAILLLATQTEISTESILFEVVSAFGTVGFSMGATTQLDFFGKMVIITLMFLGRVGPLTLTLALGQQTVHSEVRYPEGRVMVG